MFGTAWLWETSGRYRHQQLLREAHMMQLAHQVQDSVAHSVGRNGAVIGHSRHEASLVSAYVFVACSQPKRLALALRRLPGVIKADALLGGSEALLVVEQRNFESLQTFLSEVQATPGVRKVSVKLAA